MLLQELQGYTKDDLEDEDPAFLQRVLIIMEERAKEQKLAERRAGHRK